MIYRKTIYILLAFLMCMFVSCTTEVEICKDTDHQHLAEVELEYDFSSVADGMEATVPDSMLVVAYRIIRSWKCTYISHVSGDDTGGRFIYNRPAFELPVEPIPGEGEETEGDTSETGDTESPGTGDTEKHALSERFLVRQGEYRFIAFNNVMNSEIFEDNMDSRWFTKPGTIDKVISEKEIKIYYRSYNLKNEHVNIYGKDWTDFNPYTTYISGNAPPIYFHYTDVYSVNDKGLNKVNIELNNVSQNIELRFSIEREDVKINEIVAEISGIPCGMNLMTGVLDLTKTYKTLFNVNEVSEGVDSWSGVSEYAGNITVMGLAASNNIQLKTGPGIMQLAIYASALDEYGREKPKVFHLGINLFNTINKYAPVISGFKNKVVLDIDNVLKIRRDEVLDNSDSDTGLDRWVIYDDVHVDI
ncbi:MAG: hypothetical protein IKY71_02490 [Bacteroidaceae bacterium]|nr:hypothetical protein [Bacteroidaceae bacterium]